jgi:hypothetical protein
MTTSRDDLLSRIAQEEARLASFAHTRHELVAARHAAGELRQRASEAK